MMAIKAMYLAVSWCILFDLGFSVVGVWVEEGLLFDVDGLLVSSFVKEVS